MEVHADGIGLRSMSQYYPTHLTLCYSKCVYKRSFIIENLTIQYLECSSTKKTADVALVLKYLNQTKIIAPTYTRTHAHMHTYNSGALYNHKNVAIILQRC